MSEAYSSWNAAPAPMRALYPLQIRDHSLSTAMGLLMRSLPYALARFGVQLGFSVAVIVWMVITFGGAAWLADHVANVFAVVWLVVCLVGIGWFWGTVLRYALHLIACGHVAVLMELIMHGQVGNGSESMFAYGKRIVTARFGQITLLFGFNALVRGVINAFHNTLDWIAEALPIPGLESVAKIIDIVLRGATRYLDKVIFSFILARNDGDPGRDAREALVYYAQNAKPILKTSIWMVIQERILTFLVFLLMLIPAGLVTMVLPHSMRETGGIVTLVIAILLAWAIRAAFVAPLFLVVMMIRFHALIENQPIHAEWDERLAGISDKFRTLGQGMTL